MGSTQTDERPLVVNLVSETVGGSHGHGVHTAFVQTHTALQRAGVDVRINQGPGCDVVHIETMGPKSLILMLRTRERALVTAHITPGSFVGSFALANLWWPIGAAYLHLFYALADEVLAVSPDVVDGLERMHVRAPVRYVPNAIDVERFRPQEGWRETVRAKLGIAPDAFVVICAGQVQPRKGVRDFIETAMALPDVTFVWVGGMPFKRITAHYLEMKRLEANTPPNCIFAGDVDYEDMPMYYAAADCLLFPSLQETFGLAIIEAAAAGLPLILRDLETYRAIFGGAYMTGAGASFADRVRELRDDPEARATWGKRARDMAGRYDVERQGRLLLDAYHDVLARAEGDRSLTARTVRPVLQWAVSEFPPRR